MSTYPSDVPSRSRSGEAFGSLKIIPVPPGHEHEPDEMCANFDLGAGVVYVREEDWPLIRAELQNLPTRQ